VGFSSLRIQSPVTNQASQYHQDTNPSLLLTTQQICKIAFNRSLHSKSYDLDLFNTFPNLCSGAALLDVQTVQVNPPENGQSG
jgi:hypothetical protein